MLRSPPPSTEPKTAKTRKVPKKSPERSLGPPRPRTPKKSKKSPKSREKVWKSTIFFETFRVFAVLGSVDGGGDPKLSAPNGAIWLRLRFVIRIANRKPLAILRQCKPSQENPMFWLVVQEFGIAILTAIWTGGSNHKSRDLKVRFELSKTAIWGKNSCDLGSAISNH